MWFSTNKQLAEAETKCRGYDNRFQRLVELRDIAIGSDILFLGISFRIVRVEHAFIEALFGGTFWVMPPYVDTCYVGRANGEILTRAFTLTELESCLDTHRPIADTLK